MADLGAIGTGRGSDHARSSPAMASMGTARVPLNIVAAGSVAVCEATHQAARSYPAMASMGSGWIRTGLRSIRLQDALPLGSTMWIGSGRSDVEGSATPSLAIGPGGRMEFRIPVSPGFRTISVMAKQATDSAARPVMKVQANTAVGQTSDQSSTAPAGTGWVTITAITFTCTALGAVVVQLCNPAVDPYICYFDNLTAL